MPDKTGCVRGMSSKVLSAAIVGLECEKVEVEADVAMGLTNFIIVGLPDTAVQESRERVRSAMKNSGMQFPRTRITVNLAPADLKKEGPSYDLPIAISILLASGELMESEKTKDAIFVGELALDGSLRSVSGILSVALSAKANGAKRLYVPAPNADEAALVEGLEVIAAKNLLTLFEHLVGTNLIQPTAKTEIKEYTRTDSSYDFSFIKGQEYVKRALEVAAAGGHNILMSGPPGAGKTLLARTLSTILPELSFPEQLEVTKITSVAGTLSSDAILMRERPFRSPHHTASAVALVGGGSWPKPGEVSLAHRGVLFLDEFPEFNRGVLEGLRQPLEDGFVTVSRAAGTLRFPAKFMLVAARNPCPCGYAEDKEAPCSCSPMQIIKYQRKISGPLLDRIDIHINVPRINFEKLSSDELGESSAKVRARVNAARELQLARLNGKKSLTNSELSTQEIKEFCKPNENSLVFLRTAVNQFKLSARAYHKVLKVARTIADLAGSKNIELLHLTEAMQYRPKAE